MIEAFARLYGSARGLRVFRAPGRVNLIGEHTDYNLGLVLPMALELATHIGTAPATDGCLRLFSESRGEMREFAVAALGSLERAGHWTDYPLGVARELERAGFPIQPANLYIRSTVPEGAGLSSSAALEVSSALALLGGRPLEPLEVARLCQRGTRNFVGVPCGIMDQYVSVFGRGHSAVKIDCRSLEHRYVTLPEDVVFATVDTMVKHAHAASAYGERVRECAAAVQLARARFPRVESLRDLSPGDLSAAAGDWPPVISRRARHVISENARVTEFIEGCHEGDLDRMGRLMFESHRSLQEDYEVSCEELDSLVEAAQTVPGVYGSRMTGGGFGGSTVTMLRPDALALFRDVVLRVYEGRSGVRPKLYVCEPSDGAAEVKNFETIPDIN